MEQSMMDLLPESVLLHIFSCLDKITLTLGARRVCRRWYNLADDASLWRVFTVPRHFTNTRLQHFLASYGSLLSQLDCNKCDVITDDVFLECDVACMSYLNLTKLVLPLASVRCTSDDDEDEDEVIAILDYMKHLSQLFPNLQHLENIRTNIRHTVDVLKCQSYFPNLRVIHDKPISSYGRLGHMTLTLNAKKKEMWLENVINTASKCAHVDSYRCVRGTHYVDELGLSTIAANFKQLKNINLHWCSLSDSAIELFRSHVGENLETINLNHPGGITMDGYQILINNCPRLKKLALVKCPMLTKKGLINMTSSCTQLTELIIDNSPSLIDARTDRNYEQISNNCVKTIARNCRLLQVFRISKSSALTSAAIDALCRRCHLLTRISLSHCTIPRGDTPSL